MSDWHVGSWCRRCARTFSRCNARDSECMRHRYAAALEDIAAGETDAAGNRRNHPYATGIARNVLGLDQT